MARGGGKNKKSTKNRGRPCGESSRDVIGLINSIDSISMLSEDPHPRFSPSQVISKLTCSICQCLLNRPIQLACDNLVCCTCLCESICTDYSLQCPCFKQQVSVPRVGSSSASKRTVSRRTDVLRSVRDLTSEGESSSQLAAEVNSLTQEEREALLGQACPPITISTNHALAMKADLGIPWNKLRILRR